MFDFSNYSAKSKDDDSKKIVICKMKDETAGLKPKMYCFCQMKVVSLKKAKGMNENNVAAMIHNEYKDNFLNNKCLRHWKNRIQSKNHGIENYEINSFFYHTLMIK